MSGLLDTARRIYEDKGLDGLWKWAMDGQGLHGKAHRFNACARFAAKQRDQGGPDRDKWAERRTKYAKERDHFEKLYEANHALELPDQIHFAELLYHDPPHTHVAHADRDVLIQIATVGQQKYGLRIGEFPPFDTVEPVHTGGSWHYRDPARPSVGIAFNASKLQKGGPWGLAFDGNDVDGGSDQEYAFYLELRSRAV